MLRFYITGWTAWLIVWSRAVNACKGLNMDEHRIDGHKLMLHPRRVAAWLDGQDIGPIYMEASPSGACNHRCKFCGLDFMGYKPKFLDTALFCERLDEMAGMGLKSVMYAGEGEPLLHRNMVEIAQRAHRSGIDNAMTTNAVLLDGGRSRGLLPVMSWIKVSCNAGSSETYAEVHGTDAADFDRVMSNLEQAVAIKREIGSDCTLGLQSLLLPENESEMEALAKCCRDIGLDYLVIKPYSQHLKSETDEYQDIAYTHCEDLGERLSKYSTDDFSVIFRWRTMRKWDVKDRGYSRCYGLPFWSYIDASGNVWGCSVHLTDERFCYGNIFEQTFAEIWHGEQRKKSLEFVQEHMDAGDCRVNCRLDEINRYLWELKHPKAHVNFI